MSRLRDALNAVRLWGSPLLWLVGVTALGGLYGTENLAAQLIAVVAFLPFMFWYLLWIGEALTPRRWTSTVHFLIMMLIPAASFGIRSWWLIAAGRRVPDCLLEHATEYEDSRGLRYEHDFDCAGHTLSYTSRGSPVGQRGQVVDMLVDPLGWIAPMPTAALPSLWAWFTLGSAVAVVAVVAAELFRIGLPPRSTLSTLDNHEPRRRNGPAI